MLSPGEISPNTPLLGPRSYGCENCREQHLKCDRVTPICGRCKASHRDCRRSALKIRIVKRPLSFPITHSRVAPFPYFCHLLTCGRLAEKFAFKQKWVKTAPKGRCPFFHHCNPHQADVALTYIK
ncbi:hypothetical protein B0H63DRAFT_319271 [Podospora didyma]|uniref:Zn(2)-C6 fungal-type domain-containing protein n=1 Tax=Podospora didyma TaxID=330526 RepID=A0AAE0K5W7_9PEZI|nr:hypothetical protein B0H63DRAFT_319271 [Podospora didyma]